MLLRTAVTDMGLYSSFQSILLGKLACCVTALIRIRRSQTDSETLAVDLEGPTALRAIACGGRALALGTGVLLAQAAFLLFRWPCAAAASF